MEVDRRGRGRGRGRGRAVRRIAEEGLREEIRVLRERLTVVEARGRGDPADESDEEVAEPEDEFEGATPELRLLNEDKQVKFAATKLKGHASLWWDNIQAERKRLHKQPIKKWARMKAKLKEKFLPKDYQIMLYRQAEEKINRKQNAKRGGGTGRGKGKVFGRGRSTGSDEEGSSSKSAGTTEKDNGTREGRPAQRGRGFGQGRGTVQCYRCHKLGHKLYDCPEGEPSGGRGTYVAQPEDVEATPQEAENTPETGEALVLNKVLLKPAKEVAEPDQRKALFRTICKSQGKCCKLIIDSGSTDNLVAVEMVEKLRLKKLKHPTPYKVSWL
eukprot:PITA_12945